MATARKTRKNLELRPIQIQQRILNNHDGSAIFAFGDVKALATVSGPSEVRIRDELTDRSTLDINYTPLQGVPGITALAFSNSLIQVFSPVLQLHLQPRSLIQVNLQTYSCPAMYTPQPLLLKKQRIQQPKTSPSHPDAPMLMSLQAAHINAATCACLGAAIPMKALVVAASAVVIRNGVRKNYMRGWKAGEKVVQDEMDQQDTLSNDLEREDFEILLDPSPYEESLSKSQHVFAFAFTRNVAEDGISSGLIYNASRGSHTIEENKDVMRLCREASQRILDTIRANATNNI